MVGVYIASRSWTRQLRRHWTLPSANWSATTSTARWNWIKAQARRMAAKGQPLPPQSVTVFAPDGTPLKTIRTTCEDDIEIVDGAGLTRSAARRDRAGEPKTAHGPSGRAAYR